MKFEIVETKVHKVNLTVGGLDEDGDMMILVNNVRHYFLDTDGRLGCYNISPEDQVAGVKYDSNGFPEVMI